MPARPKVKRIGPPVRGLSDFPEHSTPEHAHQALNVEYVNGGVSTRRGTTRIKSNFYSDNEGAGTARDCTIHLVRPVGTPKDNNHIGSMVAVGVVPTAGTEAGEERLLLAWMSDGELGPPDGALPGRSYQLSPALASRIGHPRLRWDMCTIQNLNRDGADVVICTSQPEPDSASVFISDWGNILGLGWIRALIPVDRTVTPFHGNLVNVGGADDPGEYENMAAEGQHRARYCRSHRGRLVLANFDRIKNVPLAEGSMRAAIWYSNLGDPDGWPLDNIVGPQGNDQGEVTGLAEWKQAIVVFRRTSISVFRLDTPDSFSFRQIVNDRGCVAHATIIDDVEGMVLFLAADGFYGFNGSTLTYLSSPIERTLRTYAGGFEAAYAVHYPRNKQVWLVVPGTHTGEPEIAFVMDYHRGFVGQEQDRAPAWSVFEWQSSAWANGNQAKRIGGLAVHPDGQSIFGVSKRASTGTLDYDQFDSGDSTDDQGAAVEIGFESRWESGPISYGDARVDRWRYIRPMIRPTGPHTLTTWWRRDGQAYNGGGDDNGQSFGWTPNSRGGAVLGAFVLDTDRLGGGADHQEEIIDVHSGGVGRYGYIGVRTTAAAGHKFDIRSVEIDVLDKKTRR